MSYQYVDPMQQQQQQYQQQQPQANYYPQAQVQQQQQQQMYPQQMQQMQPGYPQQLQQQQYMQPQQVQMTQIVMQQQMPQQQTQQYQAVQHVQQVQQVQPAQYGGHHISTVQNTDNSVLIPTEQPRTSSVVRSYDQFAVGGLEGQNPPEGRNNSNIQSASEIVAEADEKASATKVLENEPQKTCLEPKCSEAAAFVCKASLLGRKFGCNEHFCKKHKGELSIFFFQNHGLDEDDVFEEKEVLCQYHVDDANTRARCVYGGPIAIMTVISIAAFFYSLVSVFQAMGDASFEPELEAWP